MMSIDFANGMLSLILATLVITNTLHLPLLIALLVVHAIISVFQQSAFDASYAMIVPEQKLPRANGMMQTMWSLSGILSPAIAAAIITLPALARQSGATGAIAQLSNGTGLAMLIDALTFFFASAALIFLTIPSPHRSDLQNVDGQKKSLLADVKEGARYIWWRRPLLWLLGTFAVVNLLSAPVGVFQPLLLKFDLAPDWTARGMTFETALATLATIGSVGGLVGGVFISAAALVGLGLSAALYVTALMVFTSNAMVPLMNAHSQTICQTQTPRELQGHVFAVRRLIAQFTAPLGVALAGWAGGQLDPGAVIAILGAILFVFSVAQLFNPYLMRVEDKVWLDALAEQNAARHAARAV